MPERYRDIAEDVALLARVLEGDRAAAEEIVRYLGPVVRRIAASRARGSVRDDLVQDVWRHLWQTNCQVLQHWNRERPLLSYVATVARNHIIDQLRRQPVAAHEIDTNIPDPAEDAETTLLASQLARCIERARENLSAMHRRLIELRHDCDMKHQEIAEVLGRSIGYVSGTLARAERYLGEEIKEACGDHLERVPWIWNADAQGGR